MYAFPPGQSLSDARGSPIRRLLPRSKLKGQAKQANNTISKVADDLYAIIGDGGNSTVYVTNEGVILVDDKFEYDGQDIVDKVKSVTNQPIKYVLNTHLHGDHTGSNEKFLPIGRDHRAQERARQYGEEQGSGRDARGVHRRDRYLFGRQGSAHEVVRPRPH